MSYKNTELTQEEYYENLHDFIDMLEEDLVKEYGLWCDCCWPDVMIDEIIETGHAEVKEVFMSGGKVLIYTGWKL